MAKCSVCNSRKGKRKCKASETFVCSLCCAESRNREKCDNCPFYSGLDNSKDYRKVPYFGIREMNCDYQLISISELIERGLRIIDEENDIDDKKAKSIIERLLDEYHFHESSMVFENSIEEKGFTFVYGHLEKNFQEIPKEVISKVLSTILRSIKRHTLEGREYLDFIHQFIGMYQE